MLLERVNLITKLKWGITYLNTVLKSRIYKSISILIYPTIIFIFAIIPANGAAGDMLINNESKLLESGKSWILQEGYEVTVTALDDERVFFLLTKNGKEVHRKGNIFKPYVYEYRNTTNISHLILRIRVIDINDNKIQLGNIFQYSDGNLLDTLTVTPTPAILISTSTPAPEGNIRQWASSATASSEYSPTRWSAAQATSAPDTFTYGDIQTAWATLRSDDSIQWIELKYSALVYATEVNVFETYNPGALSRIDLKDTNGVYHTVWAGTDINTGIPDKIGWTNITFAQTTYLTKDVKLYLDTSIVPGWNEIDAVELVGTMTSANIVTPTVTPTLVSIPQPATPPSSVTSMFSDDFSGSTLSSRWIVINKNSDSNISLTGTGILRMNASPMNGGSDYYNRSNYNALRILKSLSEFNYLSGDGIVETKMTFSPTNNYQGAGIIICFEDTPDSTTCERAAERAFYPNEGGSVVRSAGTYVSYSNSTTYFRLMKKGMNYAGWYSSDGVNWILNGQGTSNKQAKIKYMGLFVVRQPWDGDTSVYSEADFDYFKITLIPVSMSQTHEPNTTTLNPLPRSNQIPNITNGNSKEAYIHLLALMPMVFLLSQYMKRFKK
jgi:hypothetical protein